jgi:HSP20 family protein
MGFFDKLTGVSAEEENSDNKKKERKKPEKKAERKKVKIKEEEPEKKTPREKLEEPESDGQLAIDVYENDDSFVIQSTIAGIKAEDLDISIENDLVTIRGSRENRYKEENGKYYYQECYWGAFSRQVILPEEVDDQKAEALMKDGVLTLKIPKAKKITKRKISVKEEE